MKYLDKIIIGLNIVFFIYFLNLLTPLHKLFPDFILNSFPELKYINIAMYAHFNDFWLFLIIPVIVFIFIFIDMLVDTMCELKEFSSSKNIFLFIFGLISFSIIIYVGNIEIPKSYYTYFKNNVLKSKEATKYYQSLDKYKPVSLNNYIIVNGINEEVEEIKKRKQEELKRKAKEEKLAKEAEKALIELKKIHNGDI